MINTQYIPDLIGEVVSKVNEVLSNRVENPLSVYYDWGHDLTVIKNLFQKDKSISKPQKYPLVWFVMNFKEKMGDIELYTQLDCQMYILTNTKVNYSMQERRDNTFLPVLYPIYTELLRQFAISNNFRTVGGERLIEHTKIDMPYWSEDGQTTNFYNDFIDAIQLQNLKLDVKNAWCEQTLFKKNYN